ncbi:MAG: SH3 domain-containing protein, partial [Agathobacter rectalis]
AKIEVNLRALPSVTNPDATVIATIKNGETVTRTGINEEFGWSRVEYNGQTLYCVTSYLSVQ